MGYQVPIERLCIGHNGFECKEIIIATTARMRRCRTCQKKNTSECISRTYHKDVVMSTQPKCPDCGGQTTRLGKFWGCLHNWDHSVVK